MMFVNADLDNDPYLCPCDQILFQLLERYSRDMLVLVYFALCLALSDLPPVRTGNQGT
jgi:hypothetical protein